MKVRTRTGSTAAISLNQAVTGKMPKIRAKGSSRLNAGARDSPLSGGSVKPRSAAGHGLRHRAQSSRSQQPVLPAALR